MNALPIVPRRLQLAVIAAIIITGLNFISFFTPNIGAMFLIGGFIWVASGICGAICGASILFSVAVSIGS